MGSGYSVKGSSLKSKLAFVESRFGNSELEKLEAQLKEEGFPTLFDSGWYPFDRFVRLLRIITDNHFSGNTSRLTEVGEYSAQESLGKTYRTFVNSKSFIGFLKNVDRLHHMLYNEGKSEIFIDDDENGCRIVQSGKSQIAEEDLQVALGFYCGAGRLHGIRNIQGRFTIKPDGADYILSWK